MVRILALMGIVVILGVESLSASTRWSPYYEIGSRRKASGPWWRSTASHTR